MSRHPLALRTAVPADAERLAECWSGILRRSDAERQVEDVREVLERAEGDPAVRVVVATYDGHVAGAVYLRLTTLTPLNLEPVVQAVSPHVLPAYRRHGVGRALMEAAVAMAEELGVGHVVSAAASASRDGNRFMARLAMPPYATLRIAPTAAIREKIAAQLPRTEGTRQLTQVLAVRRYQRLHRLRATEEA